MEGTAPTSGWGTIAALVLFILASIWIGGLANRAVRRGRFMAGFFLGNRGLGAWALALTATVQSGGTFMGFPSLVYTHGWSVALWIAGYMVVPITGFGIIGKRVAELSRRTGAITVPDLFRARFGSPALGLIASLFIVFYMSFMLVAQFKAGAVVMEQVSAGIGIWDRPAVDGETAAAAVNPKAAVSKGKSTPYYVGLAVFTIVVVGYTMLGGFLAAVWTDLFQSVLMFIGVLALLGLALWHTGGLENATRMAIENTGPEYAFGSGYMPSGEGTFLPVGLAASFFCIWVLAGLGAPAGIIRLMACKSTGTIRRSIYLLSFYNCCIYIPLVIICICGRALIPDLAPGETDGIIPRMALHTTASLPVGGFLAGLIIAAPFGAVMATVSSYLVLIASGLVRDVYQRWIDPDAGEATLRRLSHAAMVVIGGIAVLANLYPVNYLQSIVVFSGTGAAATFLMPTLMLAFWRRATAAGAIAAMFAGAGGMLALYVAGFLGAGGTSGQLTSFKPYYLLGIDPMLWGMAASLWAGVWVSLTTSPPDDAVVSPLFDAPAAPVVDMHGKAEDEQLASTAVAR